ncbi:hypothetical protein LCGC14_0966840 [marine sediment metagenome]|uniref:Uncharacterized protein n=1 Tax=marine sediment metagenome TaxID=412755 RepID=A0A0F9RJD0_9ZZZZ
MEQIQEVSSEEDPDNSGAEMVKSIVKCAMAIGACLQQGYRVAIAIRSAGEALRKKGNAPDLKIVKRHEK